MKRSKRSGYSLVETVIASGLSILAFYGATMLFLSGAMSWTRGAGRIDSESTTHRAVREISRELREAMTVSVDANGKGLSYRLPVKDDDGNYTMPVTWDGVSRRIELDGTDLVVIGGDNSRRICPGVILTDPQSAGGTGHYVPFSPGAGAITRSLTVMLVSQNAADYNHTATSRSRETIYLRNIPQLVK